jgi:large subunit ribosomal protein L15
MPLYRRLPKRGFTNINRVDYAEVNVSTLNKFEDGAVVDIQTLLDTKTVRKVLGGVKILGRGELTKKLTVKANAFSETAKQKIEACGGTCEVI